MAFVKLRIYLVISCYWSLASACGKDVHSDTRSFSSSNNQPTTNVETITGSELTTGEPSTSVFESHGSESASQGTSSINTSEQNSSEATDPMPCPEGTIVCEGNTAKACDGNGGFTNVMECPDVCAEGLGCTLCIPDSGACNGDLPSICNANGDGWEEQPACDPLQGMACNPELGRCDGACANVNEHSYIGCDYYTTNLPSILGEMYKYGVAVANTTSKDATITITRGGMEVLKTQVKSHDIAIIQLPRIQFFADQSTIVPTGSYRIRTTQPVTVYQYNPLIEDDKKIPPSTEASLLLPSNVWGKDYLVVSRKHFVAINYDDPGFFTVIAKENNTTVTLSPRSEFQGEVTPGPGVNPDGTGQVVLNQGDAFHVFSTYKNNIASNLSGTRVVADQPIQVFGGHLKTFLPAPYDFADNLEESLLPISALAYEYIIVPPPGTKENDPPHRYNKPQIVQIIAAEENTELNFDPPQQVKTILANIGSFVETELTNQPFRVWSEDKKKFAVVQYMPGFSTDFTYIDGQPPEKVYEGDPAMLVTVPTAQYRSDYLFFAHVQWPANYVTIIAPTSSNVKVDGVSVLNGWQTVTNQYRFTHVKLANDGTGAHRVEADKNVGISVSGVKDAASVWFPGGLNVLTIE